MLSSYPCAPSDFPEGNPCSTLYITNIDPKVKEKILASFFEHYGQLHTVKIVRDKTSGKSLSYGFVEFIDPIHAEIARVKAQYSRIERREILVMFTSERQQLVQEAKVFVKNVCPDASVGELHSHFAQISPHLFVHINTDEKGKRLNFGFVHYIHSEDAEAALVKLQDVELRGQRLQLSKWVVKETRQLAQIEARKNLYIRNLPLLKKKVIENSLKEMFEIYGEIESMLIKKAPRLNSYYALVSFKEPQAAQNALKELIANPPSFEGSTEPLFVNWYQRKGEKKTQASSKKNAIYFSNLNIDVSEEPLKEAFKQYGKIAKVVLTAWEGLENEGNVKSGYVVYETETSAENALNQSVDNNNIKDLFAFEPEIELTSYNLSAGVKSSKTKQKRKKSANQQSTVLPEQPYMYWPTPPPYAANVYQPTFPLFYPYNFYPSTMPMYPNNFYLMPPQENPTEESFNSFLYIPNDFPCSECDQSVKRQVSTISTILADSDTRPNSLGSLSALDGDHLEDSGNTEGQTSTDESEFTDNERRKSQEGTPESNKPKSRMLSQVSSGISTPNCPKRKYGNLANRRKYVANVN